MLLLLITALLLPESRGALTAQIFMSGTSGSISINTISQVLQTNLSGTCGPVSIFIHEFPVVYGALRDPCDVGSIGRPLYNITMDGIGQRAIDNWIRYDGRSLALETCGQRTCVNLQDGPQQIWQVQLRSFIIGRAYFVQSLMHNLISGLVDLSLLAGIPTSNAFLLFSSTCHVDDGQVVASIESGSKNKFVKSRVELSNVPMMQFLLVKYNERLACAEVKTITPKEAHAPLSMLGIQGNFTFRQESPFHPTHMTLNLWQLHGQAGHYGIHALPILPHREPQQNVCGRENSGELWDPLDASATISPQGAHSSWPIGNLSGRHSTLEGHDKFLAVLVDWNLPMFGNNSIVGRSVVISRRSGGAWACSTIQLDGETTRATAVFKRGAIGRIMFHQSLDDPYGDLSIYVDMRRASSNISGGHNWHVHNAPLRTESERCDTAGGHFNPYNVPTDESYKDHCTKQDPLRCEAGDYSTKHRPISFYPASPTRYVFIDTSSSLNGPDSIIGRSVVVHGAEGATTRVACANILLQRSTVGRSGPWCGAGNAHGELRASQASEMTPTLVQVTFHGLGGRAGGFHIHLLPVTAPDSEPCSNALVKGHFNPFSVNASTSPAPGNGTDDQYEVGDISGRRGMLLHQENVTKQFTDMNFPLSGRQSVLGRSLVIHYTNGTRMQCASFLQDLPSDGEWVRATAEISGNISGRISLSQIVYADGGSGDTSILVDLRSSLLTPGKTIDWFIHTRERAGEPYNPYDIPSQAEIQCTRGSLLLCRVGDLKGKHGPVAPGDKVLVTDPSMPLAGDFTVIGQRLTVRSDTEELSSLILPDVPITSLYFQRTSFNRSALREALSLVLNISSWRVTLLPNDPDDQTAQCQHVAFFIIGYNDTGALSLLQTGGSLGVPCLTPPGPSELNSGCRRTASSLLMVSLLLFGW
ncbi:uncharacterized protein [Engystomops pustulosus]|uniref:uncharacterized protein n=1 Tax=Engystomops pustulosus TaxID=76066 RepID=UPI003AFA8012